jgi:hypothetical protein
MRSIAVFPDAERIKSRRLKFHVDMTITRGDKVKYVELDSFPSSSLANHYAVIKAKQAHIASSHVFLHHAIKFGEEQAAYYDLSID